MRHVLLVFSVAVTFACSPPPAGGSDAGTDGGFIDAGADAGFETFLRSPAPSRPC